MAPRPRKRLNERAKDFPTRFALHLRRLLDKRKLSDLEFIEAVRQQGVNVMPNAIRKWISGDRLPRPQDMETIGAVLQLKDYRDGWPPPAWKVYL